MDGVPLDALVTRMLARSPFDYRVAAGDAEREVAYRLRGGAVLHRGWCTAGDLPGGMERDKYDDRAVHVIGWDGDVPMSTGRVVLPPGLPTQEACGIVVEPRGGVVDVGRMCVAHSHQSLEHAALPHEYVPWSEGRNFAVLDGEPWSAEQSRLSPIARTALELNLLTEDNLPSYHRELDGTFGRQGAWGAWLNRWTAEEGRHACCIRDYLLVTRGVDPQRLEQARMATVQAGFDSGSKPLLHACAYVAFQELATRVSHRNTGRYSGDPTAEKLLTRIAMDENLHMIFYRNLVRAALEIAPGQALRAITDEVTGFVMPGSVIPGFARKAAQIANAGIYDLRIHHDDVIMPLVRHWRIFETEGLDAEGEQARQDLAAALGVLDARAARFVERRAEAEAGRAAGQDG